MNKKTEYIFWEKIGLAIPDTRIFLLQTTIMGVLVWKASTNAIFLFLTWNLFFFFSLNLYKKTPKGTVKRVFIFSFFWPMVKLLLSFISFLLDYVETTFWMQSNEYGLIAFGSMLLQHIIISIPLALPPLWDASILFLRLLTLMVLALSLTSLFSFREIGKSIAWFLRPIAPNNGWKVALAMTLMVQYFYLIHTLLVQINITMRIRRLSYTGVKYWQLVIPHLFRLLDKHAWSQAVAVTGRHLDNPIAWQDNQKFTSEKIIPSIIIILSAIFIVAIGQ